MSRLSRLNQLGLRDSHPEATGTSSQSKQVDTAEVMREGILQVVAPFLASGDGMSALLGKMLRSYLRRADEGALRRAVQHMAETSGKLIEVMNGATVAGPHQPALSGQGSPDRQDGVGEVDTGSVPPGGLPTEVLSDSGEWSEDEWSQAWEDHSNRLETPLAGDQDSERSPDTTALQEHGAG